MFNKKLAALFISSLLIGCGGEGSHQSMTKPGVPSDNKKPDVEQPTPEIDQGNVESAPTVAQIGELNGIADKKTTYQVAAKSNSDRELTYRLVDQPSWISVNENTGLITLSPRFYDFGNVSFTLIVSDGELSTSVTVHAAIIKNNVAPTFDHTISDHRIKIGQPFVLQLAASDLNDDALTYSSAYLPQWLTLDANTGKITGTPAAIDHGEYTFTVTVSDGELTNSATLTVDVYEEKTITVTSLLEDHNIILSELSDKITKPDAIAVDNNYIYLTNDVTGGTLFVIDKHTHEIVKEITSYEKNGNTYTYRGISDVSVHNGKLYVSSLSSNRVDIFDTNTFEIITSLGIGNWYGDDQFTLVHPQAVIANDKYVFVLDNKAEIAVYQQSDIANGQFLKIKKHAYLYLGGGNLNRKQQLVIKGDHLLVNDTQHRKFAAYDISTISADLDRANAIQPNSLTNSITMLAADQQDWLTVTDKKAHLSTQVNYSPNNIAFADQYLVTKYDNKRNDFNALIDSEINNGKIYNLKQNTLVIDEIDNVEAKIESNRPVTENNVSFDDIPNENISYPLADGNSWEDITDPEKLNFRVDQLINIEFDDQHNIIVNSFTAQETHNIDINVKLKNSDTWFKAFNIDKLPAYGKVVIPRDQINLETLGTTDDEGNTKAIDLTYFVNDYRYNLNDIFDSRFSSKTDPLIHKLKTIKVNWTLNFGKYSPADGDWFKITPLYAREWVIMATNFAYLISSPEFEYTWFNFKDIYGQDFYGNDGAQESENGFFTPDEYKKYYDEIINRDWIRIGLTNKGGGLGGGDVWGVDTWIFYSHYYARIPGASLGAVGHEFGHHWGSHDSAWAKEWFGLQNISHELNQYFLRHNAFPYMDDNINAFYKASNEERYGKGVEPSYRVYSDKENTLELYLKAHFNAEK